MSKQYNKSYKKNNKRKKSNDYASDKGKEKLAQNNKSSEECKESEYKNDASWYIPDETLRNQAAAYPMNTFLGIPDEYNCADGATKVTQSISNVMAIRLNPSLGKTDIALGGTTYPAQAAINAVSRIWYNELSAITGRTSNYSPDDIAIILGAMSELVSTISFAFRLYGIAFNYSIRNRSLARSLIGAMGVDPDLMLNDMAGFRMRLNMLLVQANSLPIPGDVKIFIKNWEVYSKVFVDETSAMSQYFVMSPFSTWILDERTGSTGSKLITTYFDGTAGVHAHNYVFTHNGLLSVIEQQILALQLASTYNMVYADMLNFLEKKGGKLFSFGYLPELYTVTPQFSEEALMQIHNLTIMGVPQNTVPSGASAYATPDNDVEADVTLGIVRYNPTWTHGKTGFAFEPLLDFPFTDNPTVDDKINALRYTSMRNCLTVAGVAPAYTVDDVTIPDKYVVAIIILSDNVTDLSLVGNASRNGPAAVTTAIAFMHSWLAFRHYPTLYQVDNSGDPVGYIQENNYFTHVTWTYLRRVNDLCMYGLLECPFV